MSPHADHPGTVHVVAAPTTQSCVSHDLGRLAPPLLLAHALRTGLTPTGRVIVVGPTGAAETARACGIESATGMTLAIGQPDLGRRAFRRLTGGAERIVCWSDELAPLARRMAELVELVSTNPDRCPLPPRHFARIVVLTDDDERRWRDRGGAPAAELAWLEGIGEAGRSTPNRIRTLRDECEIDDRVLLIAALSDRPARTDARGLAFLLSVLHTTGYPVCGVAPSIASNSFAALRHIRGLTDRYRFLLTERPLIDLLDSLDIVITAEEARNGSNAVLEAVARAHGVRVIRLSHKGRAGLKSTPGAVAPVLETLDAIMAERAAAPRPEGEPAHA